MNIIGTWKGYYQYGEGYTLPQFGERVGITVRFEGSNEKFIGSVTEDPSEHSVPLQARLQGFTEDHMISFVKTYPKNPRLEAYGGTEVVMEPGQLEIDHVGYIDTQFQAIYGSWSITEEMIDEQGSYNATAYGIWMLKRTP